MGLIVCFLFSLKQNIHGISAFYLMFATAIAMSGTASQEIEHFARECPVPGNVNATTPNAAVTDAGHFRSTTHNFADVSNFSPPLHVPWVRSRVGGLMGSPALWEPQGICPGPRSW